LDILTRQNGYLVIQPGLLDLGSYFAQQPWYRLGLSNYGEEVGVITPARNDVLVQVLGYPRPGKLTLVHAQIEALSP
jgi:hypothetical protein